MIGMMMAVNPVEHLEAHAGKFRRLRFVDACLQEPSRCRVPPMAAFTDLTARPFHSTKSLPAIPFSF